MPTSQTIDMWVLSEEDTVDRNIQPGDLVDNEGVPVKQPIPRGQFLEKISEISSFLSDVVGHIQHPRIRLDEVTVSFEISNQGFLKWAIGVGMKGGTTLKFKVDPK